MERTLSTSTPPTNPPPPPTASTHKRTTSKSSIHNSASSATTVVPLFLKNCRLLDLDLLPDWPSATPVSFGNQDARARIRCTEWCLYQLFRIYDSSTTLDKLQPFFPPLEPLQSINLRAALYRCLNELKKNGALGRETVLRKSMLDDCQGDKFFEICLAFSALVLRKVTLSNKNRLPYEKPLAEQAGTAKSLDQRERDSMLPLAIAHKAALAKAVAEKGVKRQTFARLHDVLADKEADLRVRKVHIQDRAASKRRRMPAGDIALDVLEKRWAGSIEIRDALLNSDQGGGGDSLFLKPFTTLWDENKQGQLLKRDPSETGILEDLEQRTRQQKRRLQRWQRLHDALINSQPQSVKDAEASNNGPELQFDRHHHMTIRDMSEGARSPSPNKHERHASIAKYDDLLTAMREELRKKSADDSASPTKQVARVTRPVVKRQSISVDIMTRRSPEPHQRSMSQTTVPLRNMFGKRVSSKSRSYQQPKVINQREPIPLKSEIFSPLKTDRLGSASSSPRTPILTSPLEDSPVESVDGNIDGAPCGRSQDSDTNGGASTYGINPTSSRASSVRSSSPLLRPRLSIGEHSDGAGDVPSSKFLSSRNIDSLARTSRPSLAERTRISMATKPTTNEEPPPTVEAEPPSPVDKPIPEPTPRRPTLQERTRESIAQAPVTPQIIVKRPHTRSRTSQIYPIQTNAFSTPPHDQPRQPRRSTVTDGGAAVRRDLTPREELFSHEAEYDSVFKPRPKLARSPKLSPATDSALNLAGLDDGRDGELPSDDALDSPLGGRG